MPDPAPLLVPWRGRIVRVRHDDPRLTPHSPRAAVIISAAQLAGTPDGLRRVLQVTVGDWYRVAVREEPLTVGLRRLPGPGPPDSGPGGRGRRAVDQSVTRSIDQAPSCSSSG